MNKLLIAATLLASISHSALSEQAPLWEAGAGVAAIALPAYRGSDKFHHFVLPVPYFTYNGDFLKADRHGVRGELFDSDRIELNVSASASPPSKSDDVRARENMPDLKPSVEFGPQLDLTLWRGTGAISFLKLRLPLREAFTLGGTPRDIGAIFSPNLNADMRNAFGMSGWNLGFLAGPIFATKRQNSYFYSVAERYATATRPAYDAPGGYAGTQFLVSISKRFPTMWIGAYLREDTLNGAVFIDSPLVERRSYTSAGLAVSWIFGRSTTLVDVEPD